MSTKARSARLGPLHVCYFGTYEREYPRNAMLIAGLRKAGLTVDECHEPVWERQRDKSGMYRGVAAVSLVLGLMAAYLRLIVRYVRAPTHDVVIVGYIGQADMLLAWILTRIRRVPLVFNPLVSLYDTFCDDRALVRPGSPTGRALWLLDHLACRAADLVLIDTPQHSTYFVRTFHIPPSKFRVLPVGADDRVFQPRAVPAPANSTCQVLFVGKQIPLHGLETILGAAALLRDEPITFTIVGSGQQGGLVRQTVAEQQLSNVKLIDWVDYSELPNYYAQSDICLGVFGSSAKAGRVVPNKVFQGLAMGRAVLTADTPAIREALQPGQELWVCRSADAADLAHQIKILAMNGELRERLAKSGLLAFHRRYSIHGIAEVLCQYLNELVPRAGAAT